MVQHVPLLGKKQKPRASILSCVAPLDHCILTQWDKPYKLCHIYL